jgi:NADH-quinone oxidoreductase subunit M
MARTGGVAMWISSGLALAGFGMAIAALEARRGALSLRQFAGGYDRKPLLAVCFLVLGLASVGFPGTLGFVAQEALVHGVVNEFPYLGFAILVASMLNGIVVLRTYFVLFCGRLEPNRPAQGLRPREQLGFICLTALLIVAGLLPAPFVRAQRPREGEAASAPAVARADGPASASREPRALGK